MDKLTCPEGLSPAARSRVAGHRYRKLGGGILVTNDLGRRAFLSAEEYRRYLGGIDEQDPLWPRLAPKGFLARAYDERAAAGAAYDGGLLAWRGPELHALRLEGRVGAMTPETALRIVDFVFSIPAGPVSLEIAGAESSAGVATLWFVAEYARRKAEWSKRSLSLTLRTAEAVGSARAEELRRAGVGLRRVIAVAGGAPDIGATDRLLGAYSPSARDPRAWADALSGSGAASVRLWPEPAALTPRGVRGFLDFYASVLDRWASRGEDRPPVDETVALFLRRLPLALPGTDVFAELAYGADGRVYTSEAGLELAAAGTELFCLGRVEDLRYQDLGASAAVKACAAAAQSDNQPLCFQCVYKPHCALPPSANYRLQGTVWGQTPSSPLCALHMGVLDLIFERTQSPAFSSLLRRWGLNDLG